MTGICADDLGPRGPVRLLKILADLELGIYANKTRETSTMPMFPVLECYHAGPCM
jgi:hypothetical protein